MDTTSTTSNLPFNVKPEIAIALGVGAVIGTGFGTVTMAFAARQSIKKLVELTDKQSARHVARFNYVMDKAGPHLPNEDLTAIVHYLETDLMASNEDGIELGIKPEDDAS